MTASVALRVVAFCLLMLWTSPPRARAQAEGQQLVLSVGEQRVLSSAGVGSYSEGARGIIDVRLTKDGLSFVIVGERPGATTLLFIMLDGREVTHSITVRGEGGSEPADREGAVGVRDNIRLDFYFVQVAREAREQLGLAWPASVGASASLSAGFDLMSSSFTDASAIVTDQALPRLDMAQSEGWAKMLRKAAVVTANGTEAKWSGGGELNVPVSNGLLGALQQITFGSEIQVLPRYDRDSGRIELSIHADISDLASDGGTGVPGRVTATLESVVNLELGQSVVLAGLSARSESASHSGLPFLSQVPILGGLFGSHAAQRHDTDNLVVIVPAVVDAVSPQAREVLRETLRVFDAYEGDLQEHPLPSALGSGPELAAPPVTRSRAAADRRDRTRSIGHD